MMPRGLAQDQIVREGGIQGLISFLSKERRVSLVK
jgi:hypothetical protein